MTGRPIQVENMYTDRIPTADSRPHRMRESDSVIEVNYLHHLIHVSMLHLFCVETSLGFGLVSH
jgi:hypothetical protein